MCWRVTWLTTCSWTPKFFNPWRLIILRLFGSKISGIPFVHSHARIEIPWHLTMKDRACLGKQANVYSLGEIELQEGSTISQEVFLCSGSHDFKSPSFQLITNKITVEKNVFIGVRSLVLPGVNIGQGSVIGAMSVVTKDIPKNKIFAGNPAKYIGERSYE